MEIASSPASIAIHKAVLDLILSSMCRPYAVYIGIQRSQFSGSPALILFHSVQTGTCLSVPLVGASTIQIAAKVRESDLAFEVTRPAPAPAPTPSRTFRLGCDVLKSLSQGSNDWGVIQKRVRAIRSGARR
jgi:hypothetical protein